MPSKGSAAQCTNPPGLLVSLPYATADPRELGSQVASAAAAIAPESSAAAAPVASQRSRHKCRRVASKRRTRRPQRSRQIRGLRLCHSPWQRSRQMCRRLGSGPASCAAGLRSLGAGLLGLRRGAPWWLCAPLSPPPQPGSRPTSRPLGWSSGLPRRRPGQLGQPPGSPRGPLQPRCGEGDRSLGAPGLGRRWRA